MKSIPKTIWNIIFIISIITILQYFNIFHDLGFIVKNNIIFWISIIYIISYLFLINFFNQKKKENKNLKFIEKFKNRIDNKIDEYNSIIMLYYLFWLILTTIFIFILVNFLIWYLFNITIDYFSIFSKNISSFILIWIWIWIILIAAIWESFKYKKWPILLWINFLMIIWFFIFITIYNTTHSLHILNKNMIFKNLSQVQLNYIFFLFLAFLVLWQYILYKKASYYENILEKFKNKLFYLSIIQDYINEIWEDKPLNFIFSKNSFINKQEFEEIKKIIFQDIIKDDKNNIDFKKLWVMNYKI